MKFSFINASPNADLNAKGNGTASFPPLGILYLATILKEKGIEVSVLDQPAKGFTIKETVKWVEKEAPDILGFSTFAGSGHTAALISDEVKRENSNIITVFGNHYATFNSERILRKYASVDIIVRGEGENTVVDLVRCLRKKDQLKQVRGITFRNRNRIVSTLDQHLITDLDSLPFPDRKLVGTEYHSIIVGANVAPKKFTSIVSSRGCAYKCRFCNCQKFARSMWRPRSVQNTLDELYFLASEGYKQFILVDDSFTLNKKRVIKLCRSMRKEKLEMEWICEGRVDNCSYEMAQEMARAGCKLLYFGVESAHQRILNYYNKQTTPQQAKTAVKTSRNAGIDLIVGSFIVGAPDETRQEIQDTIEFAGKLPIDFPQFNILRVFPGTDIWNEFEAKGLLKQEEHWETGISVPEICPSAVPLHEIKQMIREGFYHFVRRPSFVLKQIARTLKSTYRMGIALNNLSRMGNIRENIRNIL